MAKHNLPQPLALINKKHWFYGCERPKDGLGRGILKCTGFPAHLWL